MSVDRLLTVREVAQVFGICTRTVWRRIQQGVVPTPVRHGRCTRFRESEIVHALTQLKGGVQS